jgi:multiple antibiotic resistance protein
MGQIFRQLGLTFIPLFVAMDYVGNLPILIALTRDMTTSQRSGTVRSAMLTAFALGLGFIIIGQAGFQFPGIEVADFLVAGGIILLVLSIKDLVTGSNDRNQGLVNRRSCRSRPSRHATNRRAGSAYYSSSAY